MKAVLVVGVLAVLAALASANKGVLQPTADCTRKSLQNGLGELESALKAADDYLCKHKVSTAPPGTVDVKIDPPAAPNAVEKVMAKEGLHASAVSKKTGETDSEEELPSNKEEDDKAQLPSNEKKQEQDQQAMGVPGVSKEDVIKETNAAKGAKPSPTPTAEGQKVEESAEADGQKKEEEAKNVVDKNSPPPTNDVTIAPGIVVNIKDPSPFPEGKSNKTNFNLADIVPQEHNVTDLLLKAEKKREEGEEDASMKSSGEESKESSSSSKGMTVFMKNMNVITREPGDSEDNEIAKAELALKSQLPSIGGDKSSQAASDSESSGDSEAESGSGSDDSEAEAGSGGSDEQPSA